MEAVTTTTTNVVDDFVARRSRNEQKRRAFETLIAENAPIRLHVRPGRAGLPGHVKAKSQVVIDFKIDGDDVFYRDLEVNSRGLEARLYFKTGEHYSTIPWSCVFAVESLMDSRWSVWDEDAPDECNI